MRRQRFIFTLPSDHDSSLFMDSDNASVSSTPYSYLENAWPKTVSTDTDAVIPYYTCPYPLFEIPVQPVSYSSDFYSPPLIPDAFIDLSLYNDDDLSNMYNCGSNNYNCSSPSDDEIVTEDLPSDSERPEEKNFDSFRHKMPINYPSITPYGTVTILLRHLIRVDISAAKGVYVTNPPAECIASINGDGSQSCVIHPNGRVRHIVQDIYMETLDHKATVCRRGVIFTSTKHCLCYLVDDSGTKTAPGNFESLSHDFSLEVFYSDGLIQNNFEECRNMVNEAVYKSCTDGDEVWIIGGIRIKQDEKGDVKITRNGGQCAIRTSPTTGQVSVKTFSTEINLGRYHDMYFDVRKEDKRVTANLKSFRVQNGSQKAGFNSSGRVVLF